MRIDQLLKRATEPSFSLEFFPPKSEAGLANLWQAVEALATLNPTYASVTYGAGGATRDGTHEISERIQNEFGIETMAHLSCVGESVTGLHEILARHASGGIENLMALRGDPPNGEAAFVGAEDGLSSAADLAALIATDYQFAIGGACFPEVHPEATDEASDLRYLKRKVDSGASFLVTQLFFDNSVFWSWLDRARAAGIDVPIVAGIMPIVSYAQIKRFCALCEATIPAPLADAMSSCNGDQQAEMELGIAYATAQCDELLAGGVPGIHFFALNRAPATAAIIRALQARRPWEPPASRFGSGGVFPAPVR